MIRAFLCALYTFFYCLCYTYHIYIRLTKLNHRFHICILVSSVVYITMADETMSSHYLYELEVHLMDGNVTKALEVCRYSFIKETVEMILFLELKCNY